MDNPKVAAMLGVGQTAQPPSTPGKRATVLKTNLYVQKTGYLSKKPFTTKKLGKQNWQKRWFVLKDSFLIWYKSKPTKGDFSLHPAGVLPLGGCGVFPQGRSADGFEFEVSHPDFNNATLLLRSPDEEDANDWIRWLGLCKDATWENAMLGDAQMMSLKTADTKLEREAKAALETARKNAEEIQARRIERQKLMEAHEKRQAQHKEQLNQAKKKKAELKKAAENNLKAVEERKKRVEAEIAEQKKVQQQLVDARSGLLQLEKLLMDRNSPNKKALKDDIEELKDFLEANIPEESKLDDTVAPRTVGTVASIESLEPEDDDSDV